MTTWYVAAAGTNGDGSQGSPWVGFSNINWNLISNGDTVFLDGDFSGDGDFSVIKTFTAPTYFEFAFNTKIDRFINNGKQYIIVKGPVTIESASLGIAHWTNLLRNNDGCKILNATTINTINSGQGCSRANSTDPIPAEYVEISGAYSEGDGQHGCYIVGSYNGGRHRFCTAKDSSSNASGWGVYVGNASLATTSGWTLQSGTIYRRTITSGWVIKAVVAAGRTDTAIGMSPRKFWLTEGTYGSTSPGEWAQSGTSLEINTGENPNSKTVVFAYQEVKNVVIEDCVGYEMSDAYDGVGLGFDHCPENATLRRSVGYSNPGDGAQYNIVNGGEILSCAFYDNARYGVTVNNTKVSSTTNVRQVSSAGNLNSQLVIQRIESGATVNIKNSIFLGGNYGIQVLRNSGTVTDSHNCVHGASTANYNGIAKDSSSLEQDPKLIAPATGNLHINTDSPCVRAGTKWWTSQADQPQGQDGLRFPLSAAGKPDIGAYAVREDAGYARKAYALPVGVLEAGVDVVKARKV